MTGISPRQLKAIWALSHRVGLDEGALHVLVASRTGRASLRELRRSEAAMVIDELLAKVSGRTSAPRKPGAMTKAQQALLARLAAELDWPPERLPALARRMYGASAIRELTVKQASGLIEALKAMLKRRAA
ncbi:MAG: phage protein GemA/Gp16 family protein [Nitrospirota bacterium]